MREQKYRFNGELRTINEIKELARLDGNSRRDAVVRVAAIGELSLQKLVNMR